MPTRSVSLFKHEWSTDLCDCFGDLSVCLQTFTCPCWTLSRNATIMEEDGFLSGLFCGLGFLCIGPVLRNKIRLKRNIRGSVLCDVFAHVFTPCCALIQENRQLRNT